MRGAMFIRAKRRAVIRAGKLDNARPRRLHRRAAWTIRKRRKRAEKRRRPFDYTQ